MPRAAACAALARTAAFARGVARGARAVASDGRLLLSRHGTSARAPFAGRDFVEHLYSTTDCSGTPGATMNWPLNQCVKYPTDELAKAASDAEEAGFTCEPPIALCPMRIPTQLMGPPFAEIIALESPYNRGPSHAQYAPRPCSRTLPDSL